MQADGGASGERVSQRDAQASSGSDPQHKRLDGVTLQADRHGRLNGTAASRGVAALLVTDPGDLAGERVHPSERIVVEVSVEGDVDGQGGHVV